MIDITVAQTAIPCKDLAIALPVATVAGDCVLATVKTWLISY